jgi:hypothetical protein
MRLAGIHLENIKFLNKRTLPEAKQRISLKQALNPMSILLCSGPGLTVKDHSEKNRNFKGTHAGLLS